MRNHGFFERGVAPNLAAVLVLAVAGGLAACAKTEVVAGGGNGGPGGSGTPGPGSGAGGTSAVTIDTTPTVSPTRADAAVTQQKVVCDGGDDACSCPPLNVAVLGKPGKWGANPQGDPDTALQQWLGSNSAGTARVDNFPNRVTLTTDFLAAYNAIILASLSDDSNLGPWWTYSDAEVAAFQAWVENGGGVLSLTGYASGNEMAPDNQLIGFSGITYNSDGVWGNCTDWSICNCTGSNTLSDWNRSDPVIANLSTGVTLVGYTNGHSINAPADAHVAATMGGQNALVGKLVDKGRVLVFGDEWITYTSQWTGAGIANAANCQGNGPQDKYQMAQFWYNMIHWIQPGATCFTIVNGPNNPITVW